MIVLSIGMPRAGSGWHYNLIHDLVVANGGRDAREIRRKYLLQPILTEVNCNIGALTTKRLLPVMLPSILGNTFAIKAHAGPKAYALRLIEQGQVKPTYIYRDPRAALLSAYEYGQRGEEAGRETAFSHLKSIPLAIDFMLDNLKIWEAWMNCQDTLPVRYEDLLADYDQEIERLLAFLGIEDRDKVTGIIDQYRPGKTDKEHKGMHFQKGQPERFRTALSKEDLAACNLAFGPYLEKMGYEI